MVSGIGIGQWFRSYNERRPHQALGYETPAAVQAAEESPVDLPLRLDDAGASPTTPQPHKADHSKAWYTSDEEEEPPSRYGRTPVLLSLGSTALFRCWLFLRTLGLLICRLGLEN
jgi:hypothetical protein